MLSPVPPWVYVQYRGSDIQTLHARTGVWLDHKLAVKESSLKQECFEMLTAHMRRADSTNFSAGGASISLLQIQLAYPATIR